MKCGLSLVIGGLGLFMSCAPSEMLQTARAGGLRSDWGAVLPAAKQEALLTPCSRPAPRGLTGHWIPARDDIDRLERRLASLLEKTLAGVILENRETRPAASDYYRQYGAFYRDGQRVIYVNGLHHRIVQMQRSPSWTHEPFGLCDGGLMGFGVVYNVDAGKFESFEFDGRYSGQVRTK